MIYLIIYDIKNDSDKEEKIIDYIKSEKAWWHHLKNTWIISTESSLNDINKKLISLLTEDDKLFMVDITGKKRNGWLTSRAWKWIREYDKE